MGSAVFEPIWVRNGVLMLIEPAGGDKSLDSSNYFEPETYTFGRCEAKRVAVMCKRRFAGG